MPIFPNVPIAPGVPALPRNPLAAAAVVQILISDLISAFGLPISAQWGIFQNGVPVVIADTVADFSYKQDWSIANYPIEQGGFETYDKVNTPFMTRVRLASGGSQANRQSLLDQIAAIGGTVDLYDVVTPEAIYTNVNVAGYDYRRSAEGGVGMITVDVRLVQVQTAAASSFTNTQSPSAANPVNGGTVQGQQPGQGTITIEPHTVQ
jgi:hypothetical protein